MLDDAILSREAALIFQYCLGFEPDGGKLTQWKGYATDSQGSIKELTIIIPNKFPELPPQAYLPDNTHHPSVTDKGQVMTKSVTRWRSSMHVYQVVKEAQSVIRTGSFRNGQATVSSDHHSDALKRQISTLKGQLNSKKDEFHQLQNQPVNIPDKEQTQKEIAEESMLNIENDLYELEESFDSLEIDSIVFAKKFIKLQKRYHMFKITAN